MPRLVDDLDGGFNGFAEEDVASVIRDMARSADQASRECICGVRGRGCEWGEGGRGDGREVFSGVKGRGAGARTIMSPPGCSSPMSRPEH